MLIKRFVSKFFILVFSLVLVSTFVFAGGQSEEAADDSKQFSGTEINILMLEQAYAKGFQQLAPQLEEETGIKAEVETLAQVALMQKVGVELASRSKAYDLLFVEADRLPRFAGEYLQSLDGYIEDPNLADPDLDIEDFIEPCRNAFTYNGKLYSLPFFAACQMFYYRFDILEDHGFDSGPKTFVEMLEVAKKVHNDPVPAIALRGQAGTHNIWVWSQFLYGYGGHFFKNYPDDLTPTINSPEAVEALKIYVDMMQNYSIPGAASGHYDDVVIAMQQGKVAMAIEGGPLGGRILDPEKTKVHGKVGFSVSPGGPEGQFPPFTSQGLSINAASENKEAAFVAMQWGTSKEILKQIALDQLHVAVTRNSVWQDEDFKAKYDFDWGHGSFTDAYQETLQVAPPKYRPAFEHWAEVRDLVGISVQEAVVDKKSPKAALDDAQAKITNVLQEHGYID